MAVIIDSRFSLMNTLMSCVKKPTVPYERIYICQRNIKLMHTLEYMLHVWVLHTSYQEQYWKNWGCPIAYMHAARLVMSDFHHTSTVSYTLKWVSLYHERNILTLFQDNMPYYITFNSSIIQEATISNLTIPCMRVDA